MIKIIKTDYKKDDHGKYIIDLLNSYASGITGNGTGLKEEVKSNLIYELEKRDTIHTILAFVNDKPAGLTICIEGFSTFECKPLMNIHDVVVAPEFRGQGISKLMIEKAEEISREIGCCKMTLEVLEGNTVARNLYKSVGFINYELDPKLGKAFFMEKKI